MPNSAGEWERSQQNKNMIKTCVLYEIKHNLCITLFYTPIVFAFVLLLNTKDLLDHYYKYLSWLLGIQVLKILLEEAVPLK